jgi:hypothetical protein
MLASLGAAGALAAPIAGAHDDGGAPVAQTLAPTSVASTSAVLRGTVDPDGSKTIYWFEFGPTAGYGARTLFDTTGKQGPMAVQSSISGLTKGATYHVRLMARNDDGHSVGGDVTFTTGGSTPAANPPVPVPGSGAGAGSGSGADQSSGQGSASMPVIAPPAPPELGETLGVAPQGGSVLVRVPGSTRAVALTGEASIPVGSVVDARKGSVDLSSALPGDHTQTGTFHGGLFEVRQPAGARGMTELVLRGPLPTCTGAGGARAAAASAKRPPRALWGRDDHGRFRTRGSNSVATVRGTAWYVEDRCDGTLTRVSKGSVSVRDLRRERTVIVNAGKSYLARGGR